jgi:type II secretory pathway component GspD/PulD (secretin)
MMPPQTHRHSIVLLLLSVSAVLTILPTAALAQPDALTMTARATSRPAGASPGAATATRPTDDESDRITQALDKRISLTLTDLVIREAVQQLSDAAGVPIGIEEGTVDLLPSGSRTLLTVKVDGQPLREVLKELLRQLGLTYRTERNGLTISPTEPLRRIARRATWEELALLAKLASTPWSKELFDSLQFQFQDARAGYADANRERLWELAGAVGVGTAAEVLEYACEKYGWCWAPSGNVIAILSRTRQVEKLLNKPVNVSYTQVSVEQALLDLARKAGVLLQFDPGAVSTMRPQMSELFTLTMENGTIRQALEVIAGQTGLSYFIEPTGIRIAASTVASSPATDIAAAAELAAKAARSNSVIGQLTIPNPDGTSFSFFIRENDLPPEVNKMRQAKIRKIIDQLRRNLAAEQPKD